MEDYENIKKKKMTNYLPHADKSESFSEINGDTRRYIKDNKKTNNSSVSQLETKDWPDKENHKSLSLSELYGLIPETGFTVENYVNLNCDQVDFLNLSEEDKFFFNSRAEKKTSADSGIYNLLFFLKNGTKKQKIKARNNLKTYTNKTNVLEKLILYSISVNLKENDKKNIIDLFKSLLESTGKHLIKEVCYILANFSSEPELRSPVFEVFKQIFEKHGLELLELFDEDIKISDKNIKEACARVLAFMVFCYGFKDMSGILINIIEQKDFESVTTVFQVYFFLFDLYGRLVAEHLDEINKAIAAILEYEDPRIKRETGNLVSALYCRCKGTRNKSFNHLFLALTEKLESHYQKNESVENTWCTSYLRAMSLIAYNNSDFISEVCKWLMLRESVDINTIKIISNMEFTEVNEKLIQIVQKIDLKLISESLKKFRNLFVVFFKKFKESREIKEKVLLFLNDEDLASIGLEILIADIKFDLGANDRIKTYNSIFECIKRNDEFVIRNINKFGIKEPSFYQRLILLCQDMLKSIEKRITSLKIIAKIVYELEFEKIEFIFNILFENFDDSDDLFIFYLIKCLYVIYGRCKFKNPVSIILELRNIIKRKSFTNVLMATTFLEKVMISFNQINLDNKEWARICYNIIEAFPSVKSENLSFVANVIGQISKFLQPQEVLNIVLKYITNENKVIRKGSILATSYIAQQSGFYNVLPVLMVDYSSDDKLLKISILKVINLSLKNIGNDSHKYLYSVLSPVEDALHDPDIQIRKVGLSIVKTIVDSYEKPMVDVDLLTHMLNMIWINILDVDIDIRETFDQCMLALSSLLNPDYVYKYFAIGFYHPSKKIRKRYNELFSKILKLRRSGYAMYHSLIL